MKKIIFGLSFLFCTNTFAAKLVWDANTETDLKGYSRGSLSSGIDLSSSGKAWNTDLSGVRLTERPLLLSSR